MAQVLLPDDAKLTSKASMAAAGVSDGGKVCISDHSSACSPASDSKRCCVFCQSPGLNPLTEGSAASNERVLMHFVHDST